MYESGGIPLAIQAGLLDHDGNFEPGGADAVLSVILVPPSEFHPGVGLGVLSDVASGSAPEDGLSMEEGLVFHFSALFEPRRIHLSGITLGTLRDGQRIVLPLEGRLRNGTLFVGEDTARLQVPGKGKGKGKG